MRNATRKIKVSFKPKKKKPAVIKVKDIRKYFKIGRRKVRVLRGINLEVKEGEMIVIFGPSGCGKSTLLNVLLGLEEPTAGDVEVLGEKIYQLSLDERTRFRARRMGMVYQQPIWIRSLSVLENVAFPLLNLGFTKEGALRRTGRILSELDLAQLGHQYPTTLSGGEQQKATMARAVVADPTIILADEPTGNLDTKASSEVVEILKILNQRLKRTVILVTHNPQYLHLSKTLYYMEDGRIFPTSPSMISKRLTKTVV